MKAKKIKPAVWLLVIFVGLPAAWAQDSGDQPAGKTKRKNAAGKRRGGRGAGRKASRGNKRSGGRLDVKKLEQGIEQELDLNSDQQRDIQTLLAQYQSDLAAARDQQRGQRDAPSDEAKALRKQIKAARKAGDRQAAREAQRELRKLIPRGGNTSRLTRALIGQITAIVPQAQRPKLQAIFARAQPRRGSRGFGGTDPMHLVRMAEQAGIAPEKVAAIRKVIEEFGAKRDGAKPSGDAAGGRERGPGGPRGRRGALHQKVREILTPEEFQSLMKAARQGARERGQGDRPGRGRRPPNRGRRGQERQPDAP